MAPRPTSPNILAVYGRATDAQVEAGRAWYRQAHALAAELDPADPSRAAGVLAALSPRCEWSQNVTLARRAYADGRASGSLGRSVEAANAIMSGTGWAEVLRGPKTRAFAACIADPDDRESVVIDRHAFDIAVGRVTDDATRAVLSRKGAYERWAAAYRRAAEVLGVTPAEVQAVTWVVWRAEKGLDKS